MPTPIPNAYTHMITWTNHVDHSGSVGPIATAFGETITQDKWGQPLSIPRAPHRIMPRGVWWASSPVSLTQTETITSDKWVPETDRPVYARPHPRIAPPVSSPFPIPTQSENFSVDKWGQPLGQTWAHGYLTAYQLTRWPGWSGLEVPTLDRWNWNGPLVWARSVRLQSSINHYPLPISIPPLSVLGWLEDAHIPQRRNYSLRLSGVNSAIADEIIYPDALFNPQAITIARRRQMVESSVSQLLRSITETITLDKFAQRLSEPVRSIKRWHVTLPFATQPLTIEPLLLKWGQLVELPPKGITPRRYAYPFAMAERLASAPPAEFISVDKWGGLRPDYLFQRKRLVDYGTSIRDLIGASEITSFDRWGAPISQPRMQVKKWQYIFPVFSGEDLMHVPFVPSGGTDASRIFVVSYEQRRFVAVDERSFTP